MNNIKTRLALLGFLEFAVWGSYLVSMGIYLGSVGLGDKIFWFYTVQGLVSLFMPAVVGVVADRWIPAQRMMALCQTAAGVFMCIAAFHCMTSGGHPDFATLFVFYSLSVAFFMPTIGLNNSVAFNALTQAHLDTVKAFPPIRVWGTVGFICAELFVNFTGFQNNYMQLYTSGILSFFCAAYALTMPNCPVNKEAKSTSLVDVLGLRAFKLFKQKKMAIFLIFSMLLGVSLQITNSYGTLFISSFKDIAHYANDWAANNATALTAVSQASETLCILLIPWALRKFGIKGVMLIAMFAWVGRFGFFGLGDTGTGVLLLLASCIVYGVAFDFFNVSGGLYIDKETDPSIRSSAQGLFMVMTNGVGASLGTWAAGTFVINKFVDFTASPEVQLEGWRISWYIFAAYALVVGILFMICFRDNHKPTAAEIHAAEGHTPSDAGGMADEALI